MKYNPLWVGLVAAFCLALVTVALLMAYVNAPCPPGKPGIPNDGTIVTWVPGETNWPHAFGDTNYQHTPRRHLLAN